MFQYFPEVKRAMIIDLDAHQVRFVRLMKLTPIEILVILLNT